MIFRYIDGRVAKLIGVASIGASIIIMYILNLFPLEAKWRLFAISISIALEACIPTVLVKTCLMNVVELKRNLERLETNLYKPSVQISLRCGFFSWHSIRWA